MQTPQSIEQKVKAVRSRLRLQLLWDACIQAATPAGVFALLALLLGRLEVTGFWPGLSWTLCALTLVGAVAWGLFWPIREKDVAHFMDAREALHDRLSIALELAQQPNPSPFAMLAIEDAEQACRELQPSRVKPFQLPKGLQSLGWVGFSFALLPLVQPPAPPEPLKVIKEAPDKRLKLSRSEIELFKDKDEEKQTVRDVEDAELKKLLKEIKKLQKDLADGKLTRREFFSRLDELKRKLRALMQGKKAREDKKSGRSAQKAAKNPREKQSDQIRRQCSEKQRQRSP